MVYGEQIVGASHLVRFVRLYETERVTSETPRGKRFLRLTNKVVRVEEPSEVPGHSVGDLDAKTEVGRNLGLRATEK